MFNKEKDILGPEYGINWIKTYPGYDLGLILKQNIIAQTEYIYTDIKLHFYTFDHFYKFTLPLILKKFIRTRKKIYTSGQLLNYFKKLNFDKDIQLQLQKLNYENLDKNEKFLLSWNIIFDFMKKIKAKNLILANAHYFIDNRNTARKEVEFVFRYIIQKCRELKINLLIEYKFEKGLKNLISGNDNHYSINFEDFLNNYYDEKEAENFFGELDILLKKDKVKDINEKMALIYFKRLGEARGGNQLKYILFLISLSGSNGLKISELSYMLEISAGAAGSALSRLVEVGLIRKIKYKYIIRNSALKDFILEYNR
ncbi:MAG: hypothetical protein ACQESP_01580 [Candidatus Muiribacteriota bacterium]